MRTSRAQFIADRVLAVTFMAFVTLPLLGTYFDWDLYEVQENRRPTPFPDLGAIALDEIPDALDEYYKDEFGFRNFFIRRWNKLQRQLDKDLIRRVIRGRDDWLFEDRPDVILDFLGRTDTTVDDLEAWRAAVEDRHAWLAERGIDYVFGLAPNKPSVYPEMLPEDLAAAARPTRREMFLDYMAEHSAVPVLDLRPAIFAKKSWKTLYLSHDTHWNAYGAFLGYGVVLERLRELMPELAPMLELADCEVVPSELYGNLARHADLPEDEYTLPVVKLLPPDAESFEVSGLVHPVFAPERVWPNNNIAPPIYRNPSGHGRAVVFHDSMFLACVKFLAQHFEETTHIWHKLTPEALEAAVEAQQPDVVIEIIAERILYEVPEHFEHRK